MKKLMLSLAVATTCAFALLGMTSRSGVLPTARHEVAQDTGWNSVRATSVNALARVDAADTGWN